MTLILKISMPIRINRLSVSAVMASPAIHNKSPITRIVIEDLAVFLERKSERSMRYSFSFLTNRMQAPPPGANVSEMQSLFVTSLTDDL